MSISNEDEAMASTSNGVNILDQATELIPTDPKRAEKLLLELVESPNGEHALLIVIWLEDSRQVIA